MILAAAARWLLFSFAAGTSLYCLLCHIPFSWNNFVKDQHYPVWVGFFVRTHAAFLFLALAPAILALKRRRLFFAHAAGGPAMALSWLLMSGRVRNDAASLLLSLLCWLPCVLWEILLLWDRRTPLAWSDEADPAAARSRLPAALLSAGFLCAAFSTEYLLRGGAGPSRTTAALALGWSLLSHLCVLLLLCACLGIIQAAARLRPSGRVRAESLILLAAIGTFAFWILDELVLGSLSFVGPAAWCCSAAAAAAAALALWGQARDLQPAGSPVGDAVDFVAAPGIALWRPALGSRPGRLAALAALAAAPWLLRLAIPIDWNRLLATLATLAAWAACYSFFHGWLRSAPRSPSRLRPEAAIAAVILLSWAADFGQTWLDPWLRLKGIAVAPAVRRLADEEISLRTARRLLRRRAASGDFYQFLQANTNISRKTRIEPREIRLATAPPNAALRKPHVFILVADSLRPDYLGAYNPQAGFTPAINAFAAESIVWRRAFSAYGATGLSEPSIWAGARLLHQQYVTPFSPMNSLERLTEEEGYQRLISLDVILTELLKPSPRTIPIGGVKSVENFKFCQTLSELSAHLRARDPASGPIFAYLQPQDLHVSVIDREGRKPVDDKDYPGFYAPYASRVARIDACFGRFLSDLKEAGLYEDSVVILTSDHGDSLGEGDRWGHAYTIFPEILRVPLIMRVPERLRRGLVWNADSAAFLTDLTPTLYAILGRAPRSDGEILGRPLLAASREELARGARAEMPVVSSYGPVYGLLQDDGRFLYIVDAINFAAYYFDLAKDPAGTRNLATPEIERAGNEAIRRHIEALNEFCRFQP